MDKVEYRYPPEEYLIVESKTVFSGTKTESILSWAESLDKSLDKCHTQLDSIRSWIDENKRFPGNE